MSSTVTQRKPLLSRVPADFVRAVLKGHSGLGLAFAAAIYLVCLTGSIAVFAHEFQRWELAGTPRLETLSPNAVQRALAGAIERVGGGVEHAYITMPSPELPQALVAVEKDHVTRTFVADANGVIVASGDTPWTEFITRLHINLHLPQSWGVFIVGLTGVALLSSLISGILAHPRIFRDAFHVRMGGSRRLQEADLHNRLGVWAMPFHVIVSLTGALLGLTTIIVGVLGIALFQGDVGKVYALFIPQTPKDDPRPAPLLDLRPFFAQVEARSGGARIDMVMLEHPSEMGGAALFYTEKDDGRLHNSDSYAFNRAGSLYHTYKADDAVTGQKVLNSLGKLHFGWFGGGIVKILYGLLGLALTYLAAGGVLIWLARRRDKRNPAPGFERLWAATIWGQPVAIGLAALTVVLAGAAASKMVLVTIWGIATLVSLALAIRTTPDMIARALKCVAGLALILTALAHPLLRPSGDPVAWAVDATLLVCGGLLLRLAKRQQSSSAYEDAVLT
ncbi:putative iron-regulated membrane protein [Sphingobium xanthum]|uniref:PepSY-associated TM helix domain-containing protein n=1 Tax=Sphingobium xanthum TaxID=1387165 RepID=UPI001C8BA4AF|nr:PepSY-associated TM helix domain-containing protein [Sphingobium xanthum]